MSKSSRLFEIIQILRAAEKPVRAQQMAQVLEVSERTIYRDIASLQAMQTPILGEAGVGYVMRKGYDLPPINLEVEEAEAIAVGLSLIARTGDPGLWRAAGRASRKLQAVAPGTRRLVTSSWGLDEISTVDLGHLRAAIREERKLAIRYVDGSGAATKRVIWPLVLIYYVDAVMIAAWCELRKGLRHFRLDRIEHLATQEADFKGAGAALLHEWEQTQKAQTVTTRALSID
ncbi:helix-turn-helix transcriptional regulator [Sulfitobacter aestuariivivens]|uniref:YafY family transcriptional regulator n=1 Tax=Sulfitobacter aestuariivivens TaxID=2766981 RepID=A0A927D3E0_9RHOB|nr:YafY family protein [Sulfitobacter aestuariivivens]MBD3664410.1 YafY family transcriptional regulator [Sulfitobacter aestuariivivens]